MDRWDQLQKRGRRITEEIRRAELEGISLAKRLSRLMRIKARINRQLARLMEREAVHV